MIDKPETAQVRRIFISSPSDVAEERSLARKIVKGLQRRYAGQLQLVPVLWEELPLDAAASFTEGIDLVIAGGASIDIAVFILWSRLGSPPDALRPDGTEYRSGTEREFELMLAAQEASPAGRPAMLVYCRDDPRSFQELLEGKPTTEIREMVEQKALVEKFIEQRFSSAETGLNARAYHEYDTPFAFGQRFRVHLQAKLDAMVGTEPGLALWDEPPFRGLEAFDTEHAAIFNGRETEVADVVVSLTSRAAEGCAAVIVMGASGSGKSSLVRAGVIPALIDTSLSSDDIAWRHTTTHPGTAGPSAVQRLAHAFFETSALPALEAHGVNGTDLAAALSESVEAAYKLTLKPAIEQCDDGSKPARLLIFVDQLEELATRQDSEPGAVGHYLAILRFLASTGRISVVLTVRSDFYAQLQEYPDFVFLKQGEGHYDLLLPTPSAIQRIITRPALLAGLRFEEDATTERTLASQILDDASGHPEALPLLQFALREVFERRSDEGLLTFAAYEQLGGVAGALSHRAEQVFQSLDEPGRLALDSVMSELVTIDEEDSAAVRRQANLEALRQRPGAGRLVESFTAERLLVAGQGPGGQPVVEVAHEALLRNWERAARWVDDNRGFLAARARIQRDFELWKVEGRHSDYLITAGKPLEDARQVLHTRGLSLTPEQAEFVTLSVGHHEELASRQTRRARIAAGVLFVLAISAIVGGIFALVQRNAARLEVAKNQKLNVELEEQLYENRIAVAERELTQDHDIDLASSLLLSCPKHLRGWEWSYLMQRRDREPLELRHERGLWTAAFHPSEPRLVTTSVDGTARIWDAEDGSEISVFSKHNSLADALPPLVKKLIPGDLIGLPPGELIERLPGTVRVMLPAMEVTDITVKCATYSPSGDLVASGSIAPQPNLRQSKGVVKIWKPDTGEVVRTFDDHVGIVLSLAFSPDGRTIASSSMNPDYTFLVWDVATGEVRGVAAGHRGHVYQVGYHRDGNHILSASIDGTIRLWDATSLQPLNSVQAHPAPVMDVTYAPDGTTFASAGQDGTVRIWDAESLELQHELRGHQGSALSLAYHPSGDRIVSSGFDKTVRIWDPKSGRLKLTLRGHEDNVWDVAFSADGRRLVSASYDDTALVWDSEEAGTVERDGAFTLRGHADRVNRVVFSAQRNLLATSSWDQDIRIWDAKSGEQQAVLSGHEGAVWGLAFDTQGKRLASAGWDHTVRVWNATSGQELATYRDCDAPVQSVAFTPDDQYVVASSWDGLIKVWDLTSDASARVIDASLFPVFGLDISPNGLRIAAVSGDRKLRVWDLVSGTKLIDVVAHEANAYDVCFGPLGQRIATSSWDGTARVWDVGTEDDLSSDERLLVTFKAHTDRVFGIDFAPDGSRVATASGDKFVRIWDAATGDEVSGPFRHRGVVWDVGFDTTGQRLATASWTEHGWVRTWFLD